jgi:hypothetical protein
MTITTSFNGLHVAVPQNRKCSFEASPIQGKWQWDSITVIADQLPDGSFQLSTNGALVARAKVGDTLSFAADGRLIAPSASNQ